MDTKDAFVYLPVITLHSQDFRDQNFVTRHIYQVKDQTYTVFDGHTLLLDLTPRWGSVSEKEIDVRKIVYRRKGLQVKHSVT